MGFWKSVRKFLSNPITRGVTTVASGLGAAGAYDGLGAAGKALTDISGIASAASGIASIASPEQPGWSRALGAAQVGLGGYNLLQNRSVGGFGDFGSAGIFGGTSTAPAALSTAGTQRPSMSLNSAFGVGGGPAQLSAPSPAAGTMLATGASAGALGNPLVAAPQSSGTGFGGSGGFLSGLNSGAGAAPAASPSPWAFVDDSASGAATGFGVSNIGNWGATATRAVTQTPTERGNLFSRVFGGIADAAAENPLGAIGQGLGLVGVASSLFAPDPVEQTMSDYDARFDQAVQQFDARSGQQAQFFDPDSEFGQSFMADYRERRLRDLTADYDQALSELRSQFAARGMLDSSVFVLAQDELLQSRMELESNISQEAYDAYLQYALQRQQGVARASQIAAAPFDVGRSAAGAPIEVGLAASANETNFGPFAQTLANYD